LFSLERVLPPDRNHLPRGNHAMTQPGPLFGVISRSVGFDKHRFVRILVDSIFQAEALTP